MIQSILLLELHTNKIYFKKVRRNKLIERYIFAGTLKPVSYALSKRISIEVHDFRAVVMQ